MRYAPLIGTIDLLTKWSDVDEDFGISSALMGLK
jgi:hypothetical protein